MATLIEAWLSRTFPHHHALCAEIANDLRSNTPIPIDVLDPSFLGNLVERAIGLSLCDQAPYLDLFGLLGDHRAARLLHILGYREDQGWRRTASPSPTAVFLAAYRLAQIIEFTNPRWGGRVDPEVAARILLRHPNALPRHGSETGHECQAFDDLWMSYRSGFATALRSYGSVTTQVPLLHGRRVADLFAGPTIVEIKSGRLDQHDYLTRPINQLITYALLARAEGQPVTHVALYAIRHQRLLRFRIGPFLTRLAGRRIDIQRTGSEVARLLQDPPYPQEA